MKRGILFFCLLLAAGNLIAQTDPRELWPQITVAAQGGDFPAADSKIAEMLENGKTLGIRRYPIYAEAATALAREAARQNDADLAAWGISAANRLDPYSPVGPFTAADL